MGASSETEEQRPRVAFLGSRQFLLMWLMFFANITARIAIIGFQSPLLQDLYQKRSPGLTTSTLASYGATLIRGLPAKKFPCNLPPFW